MKQIRWKAHLNVPTAITPGHIIKVDDAVACPVAIVMAGTGSKGPKEQEDNARLIAAAPEMKTLLTEIAKFLKPRRGMVDLSHGSDSACFYRDIKELLKTLPSIPSKAATTAPPVALSPPPK